MEAPEAVQRIRVRLAAPVTGGTYPPRHDLEPAHEVGQGGCFSAHGRSRVRTRMVRPGCDGRPP